MSKRVTSLFLCLVLVASLLTMTASAEYSASGKVTASALRLREQPSTSAKILDTAAIGASVTILNEEPLSNEYGAWYRVKYNGTEGFMDADYISIDGATPSAAPSQAAPSQTTPVTGTVSGSRVNFRTQPNTNGGVIAILSQGTTVAITGLSNGWYGVTYNGASGYMSAEYISADGTAPAQAAPSQAAPSQTAPPAQSGQSESMIGYGTVNGSRVNFRTQPNTNGGVIALLSQGTLVDINGLSDGWYGVTYNGASGYMSAEYVTFSAEKPTPLASAPSGPVDPAIAALAAYGSGYGGKATTTATDRLVAQAALDASTPSETQRRIVETAMSYLGCPYVYGASNGKNFDCGGFTSWVYRECGLPINRTAVDQFKGSGTLVASKDDLRPGDLVLFKDPNVSSKIVTHVGMYVGQGKFIHAGSGNTGAGKCVKINDLATGYYSRVYHAAKHVTD